MRFTPFWVSLMGDLQKSDCYGLNSERKKVLTSSPGPLTCLLINLSAFGSMNIHFLSEKLILLDFSSPRGVTTLGCEFHSQAGLARLYSGTDTCDAWVSEWGIIKANMFYSRSVLNRLIQAVLLDKYCQRSNIEYAESLKTHFLFRCQFFFKDYGVIKGT